jgi:hypothetical protein
MYGAAVSRTLSKIMQVEFSRCLELDICFAIPQYNWTLPVRTRNRDILKLLTRGRQGLLLEVKAIGHIVGSFVSIVYWV